MNFAGKLVYLIVLASVQLAVSVCFPSFGHSVPFSCLLSLSKLHAPNMPEIYTCASRSKILDIPADNNHFMHHMWVILLEHHLL